MRAGIVTMILVLCGLALGCESLVEPVRDNPRDPHGEEYTPPPPTGLSATFEDGIVELTWKNTSRFADGILIERMRDSTGVFNEIDVLDTGETSYRDSLDFNSFTLAYRVAAFHQAEDSRVLEAYQEVGLDLYDAASLTISIEQIYEHTLLLDWPNPYPFPVTFRVEMDEARRETIFVGEYEVVAEVGPDTSQVEVEYPYEPNRGYRFRVAARYEDRVSPYSRSSVFIQDPN